MFGYTHDNLIQDFKLLYENTAKFNGDNNELTRIAREFVSDVESFVRDHLEVCVVVSCYCSNL